MNGCYAYSDNTNISNIAAMKTITLKADEDFDRVLTGLAHRTHTSKSGLIRAAVVHYRDFLEREELQSRIRAASLKTRQQALTACEDMADADADGL